jgi:hypothetical protein
MTPLGLVLVAAVMAADPEPRRAIDSGWDDVADMLREMTPIRVCWLDDSGPVQLYRIHADHLETLPDAEGETIAEATDGLPDEPIYTDSPLLPVMPCPDRPIRAPGDMDGAP